MNNHRLELRQIGIVFEAERLRRERDELIGELRVFCHLPGARTVNGTLATADFNFSSLRARQDRAKFLKERARTNGDIDWYALLEEFVQGVFNTEREGDPAVDLRSVPKPTADEISIHGLAFPRRHPSILFGDGGSAKSYTALWLAGELVRSGMKVALFDWELCGEDHRDRLERLYGEMMPEITYCRCEKPLHHEVDRLQRVVREKQIQFAIYDSVAFACGMAPEMAEAAGKYFMAVREINCGSLHIAHQTKGEMGDQKPFGSVFWFNGARSIWYAQANERLEGDNKLQVGFIHRKNNLGQKHPSVGFRIEFHDRRTIFTPEAIQENADAAAKLSVKQRMFQILKSGSLTFDEIGDQIGASAETVKVTAYRERSRFIVLSGGRVGLVDVTR